MREQKFVQMVLVTNIYGKKPFKNLLWNQKADDLGTWFVAFGMWPYQVCSNGDPRFTLTYIMTMSNLLPNAFK